MIDIHNHILPGIDDGAAHWAATLEMCRQALTDGVTHIVATPHANWEYAYCRESALRLLDELRAKVPGMQFSLGCDFHVSMENVRDALRNPNRYTINDSPYILVEFNEILPARQMLEAVLPLLRSGLVPIVTHPERNGVMLRNPDLVKRMVDVGCLVQVTANSLTGFWGSQAKRMSMGLLKENLVQFLATDAHSPRGRTPILSAGLRVAAGVIGMSEAMKFVWDNAKPLVDSQFYIRSRGTAEVGNEVAAR